MGKKALANLKKSQSQLNTTDRSGCPKEVASSPAVNQPPSSSVDVPRDDSRTSKASYLSNENGALICADHCYDSDESSMHNSACSEFILEDEDRAEQMGATSTYEKLFTSFCDRFIQSANVGNTELQERLQLSFLIQKYSDLVSKNSPFKIPKLGSEEREKLAAAGTSLSRPASTTSNFVSAEPVTCNCPPRTEEFNLKEKEHLRHEITKVNALKSRLESLCKDLQLESKRIKEEGKKFFRSVDSCNPFRDGMPSPQSPPHSSSVTEMTECREGNPESYYAASSTEDMQSLNAKYHALLDSYEQREKHFQDVVQYKDAQLQHSMTRFVEQHDALNRECTKVETLKSQIMTFVKTENELKRQLAVYVDKFKQVEETLSKSNELFMTFRKETEKMTKNLAKFEKENEFLKNKVGTLNKNIFEMAEEKAKNQKTTETLANQKMKLEVLCRTLQAERNEALAQLSKLKKGEAENAPAGDSNGDEKAPQ